MRILFLSVAIAILIPAIARAQDPTPVEHILEGSKVVVELFKTFNKDKHNSKLIDCEKGYGHCCVLNSSEYAIEVILEAYGALETREMVVPGSGNECALNMPVGTWSYEIIDQESGRSLRKGDLLLEVCESFRITVE